MEKQSFFRVQKKNVEEEKYVICIKDELASKEEFDTREEAEQYIESKPWELIFNLNVYTIQVLKTIEDEKKGE